MLVELAASRPREELVGDVADQHVLERVLVVALDRRDSLAPDQVAALEVLEQLGQAVADIGHALEAALPEHLALHGGVDQHRSLGRGQGVQARRDDPADRRRQGAGLGRGFPGGRGELLDEERIPLGGRGEQRRPLLTIVERQLLEQQLARARVPRPPTSGWSGSAV